MVLFQRGPENILFTERKIITFTQAIKNAPLRETQNFEQISSGYFLRQHLYSSLGRLPWNFAFSDKGRLWNFRVLETGRVQCICRPKSVVISTITKHKLGTDILITWQNILWEPLWIVTYAYWKEVLNKNHFIIHTTHQDGKSEELENTVSCSYKIHKPVTCLGLA